MTAYWVRNLETGEVVSFTYEGQPPEDGPRYDAGELLGIKAYSWAPVCTGIRTLRRIELRDKSGDWRGLFRAIPRIPVAPLIQRLASTAPWDMLDLVREPRFFFTEKAWREYAGQAYTDLQGVLGEDVRLVEVQESEDLYAVVIDEEQVAVYDFALH